jgi:hypothetical protein
LFVRPTPGTAIRELAVDYDTRHAFYAMLQAGQQAYFSGAE